MHVRGSGSYCSDAFALIAIGYNSQGRISRLTSSNVEMDAKTVSFISFVYHSK